MAVFCFIPRHKDNLLTMIGTVFCAKLSLFYVYLREFRFAVPTGSSDRGTPEGGREMQAKPIPRRNTLLPLMTESPTQAIASRSIGARSRPSAGQKPSWRNRLFIQIEK